MKENNQIKLRVAFASKTRLFCNACKAMLSLHLCQACKIRKLMRAIHGIKESLKRKFTDANNFWKFGL